MSDIAIHVEGLGKKYVIAHEGKGKYTTLRDVISNKSKKLVQRKQQVPKSTEEFWALKDVDFEIKKGEAVGIIGKNGAGKSTLLKILSRITEPTHGRIELNGRVASLLEVGTGFHPELTGRENIFLNGAILGMSRAEIRRKFDEIVDFSGVEKFLDTPVKRYSSGMYVRLAFAVAAHLEPEILVVDEVLAVGDAEFQKKCLGKMSEVSKNEGRTVLFVSHNLTAVQQLCKKAIWLNKGQVHENGNASHVIENYLAGEKGSHSFKENHSKNLFFSGFEVHEEKNSLLVPGSSARFELKVQALTEYRNIHFGVGINDIYGNRVFTLFTRYVGNGIDIQPGQNTIVCKVENLPLKPDIYNVHLYAGKEFEELDYVEDGLQFEIHPAPFFPFQMPDSSQGPVMVKQDWV